jgi:hypothetical protein
MPEGREKGPCRVEKKKKGRYRQEKPPDSDKKFGVTADRCEYSHQPGHHGRVIGIGKRRVLAPVPVVGFIGGKLDRVDCDEADGKEGDESGQDQFIAGYGNHGPNPDQ